MVIALRNWIIFAARFWTARRPTGPYASLSHLSAHNLADLNLPPDIRADIEVHRIEDRRKAMLV